MLVVLFYRHGLMGTNEFSWDKFLKVLGLKTSIKRIKINGNVRLNITMQFGGLTAVNDFNLKLK